MERSGRADGYRTFVRSRRSPSVVRPSETKNNNKPIRNKTVKTTPLTADQTKTHDRRWASLATARISTLKEFVEHAVRDDGLSSGEAILLPNARTEPAPLHDELPDLFTEHPYPSVPLVLE